MSIASLPAEILAVIVEKLGKDDWKRLVLVSQDFRNATRKLLWKSLFVKNLEKFELIMDLFEKEVHLGRSVKNLTMTFSRDYYLPFRSRRHAPPKEPLSSIKKDQFLTFIKLVPMIEQLTFHDAAFPLFTPLEVAEPLLPLLHTLTYYTRVDAVTNTFANILHMAPNVTTLSFHMGVNERNQTKQLKISSPLKSLECSFETYFPLTDESLISQSSIKNLERLKIPDEKLDSKQIAILIDTLRFCSSTLLEISFLPQSLDFEPFRPLLADLIVLETLSLNFYELPVDIFQLLPITLKHFWSYVSAKHLKHLYLYPRPLLALQELQFKTLDAEIVQYIPDSIVRISVDETQQAYGRQDNIDLRKVFAWVKNRKRKNLREICVSRHSERINNDDIVRRFEKMGIHLEMEEWHD